MSSEFSKADEGKILLKFRSEKQLTSPKYREESKKEVKNFCHRKCIESITISFQSEFLSQLD